MAGKAVAKTLIYCSEGSPEGFNPQYYTTGTTFDAVSVPMFNRLVEFDTGTTNIVPGLANGKPDELFEKVKTIRELADSFNKKSATVMEEGRRSLLDISEAAVKVTRKFDPQAVSVGNPPPPRKPNQKRQ